MTINKHGVAARVNEKCYFVSQEPFILDVSAGFYIHIYMCAWLSLSQIELRCQELRQTWGENLLGLGSATVVSHDFRKDESLGELFASNMTAFETKTGEGEGVKCDAE
jgi:hypothetical protein